MSARGLPRALTGLQTWIGCIAEARPVRDYERVLHDAGLRVAHTEPHDGAVDRMLDQIESRLTLLRMTAADRLSAAEVDVDSVLYYSRLARQAVTDGLIGYALLTAQKPPRFERPSRTRHGS